MGPSTNRGNEAVADGTIRKERRVSRACVSCRQRKTRCNLDSDGTPGHPPCRRCIQDHRDCVLATSRRGGRRPRRTTLTADGAAARTGRTTNSVLPPLSSRGNDNQESWMYLGSATENGNSQRPSVGPDEGDRVDGTDGDIEGHIASTDLLNPSDAVDLLARMADLGNGNTSQHNQLPIQTTDGRDSLDGGCSRSPADSSGRFYYPISSGLLTYEDAAYFLKHYRDNYHPFFPVADSSIFQETSPGNILILAEREPHLLTAILTVASKEDPAWSNVHEACSRHMEVLIAQVIYKGSTTVGAVEALLILAEWTPHRLQESPTIGHGEEDRGAWMQIGVAIRLAYLQGLEQTGLCLGRAASRTHHFQRRRIAWAACYMSDREVSIRLGKGFWSRGPGPSTAMHADDFPTLQMQKAGSGDLGLLFQARLEMTQLFSNAHDILYSSTSHREQLYTGGEYVRYIDDLCVALRNWKLAWGGLSFTPSVKAALILSYEFLRLYINAFAFQATINRAIARARQISPRPPTRRLFADVAGTPDARFIYESIDAANSLLSTLNDFVDPVTGLRYMPLRYYLYVIYAAVFLFKARIFGALSHEAGNRARRTINITVDRLQKSSVGANSLGERYSRSLYLLWRKLPTRMAGRADHDVLSRQEPVVDANVSASQPLSAPLDGANLSSELEPLRGFSWRDLDKLGQFIGNDLNPVEVANPTPISDTDQGGSGLDAVTDDWYNVIFSGNDVVF